MIDIFWITNVEIENFNLGEEMKKNAKRILSDFIFSLVDEGLLSKSDIKVRLEKQTLGDCGIIDYTTFQRREIRFMTKLM